MIHIGLLLAGSALVAVSNAQPAGAEAEPVVGHLETYTVRRGDTLYAIARHHDIGLPDLLKANGLARARRLKPGRTLKLPTEHILPRHPDHGIVLNIPERAVYVFRGGRLIGRYAVAVGRPTDQTATGDYRLATRQVNPIWTPPKSMVQNEGIKDEPVPPGPDNPLGDRWMGWSLNGFGFHSTTAPRSIGFAASHGCVRLYPEEAHRMFDQVRVGMPIYAVYEPVLVGERDGRFYLSIYPDIYATGGASLPHVQETLERMGLLPLVDSAELESVVTRAAGVPILIAGRPEQLSVNGKPMQAAVAPTLVDGRWIVPVRPLVEALGGKVAAGPGGPAITYGGHTLRLAADQSATDEGRAGDGGPVTTVQGTLMAPLSRILGLFGAKVDWQRGRSLDVTAGAPATIST